MTDPTRIAIRSYPQPRYPQRIRDLGCRLMPNEITDAWYAQGCPPRLDKSGISRRVIWRWRLACLLRGTWLRHFR